MSNFSQRHAGAVNGMTGSWVPLESDVGFPVSADPSNPTVGPDGAYYYAQEPAAASGGGGFSSIQANANNAIPTPSNIVQLPAIVQPIALVPFASQNQPLLQYDSNYRPTLSENHEPVYRAKPYLALSAILVALLLITAAVMCFVSGIKNADVAAFSYSPLDAITGLAQKFKLGSFDSNYYNQVLDIEGASFYATLVPILYLISLLCAAVSFVVFLINLAKAKSPRGFGMITTFLAFLFSAAAAVVMTLAKDIQPALASYIIAVLFLVSFIMPFFAKRNAQTLDYIATKRPYME